VELQGSDTQTFIATNEKQCIDACTNNRLPTGQQAACWSFDFDRVSRQCAITTQRLPPNGNGSPVQNPRKSYYEKVCLDATLVVNCPEVFNQFPQRILVGFARSVTDVTTYAGCVDACLNANARFGFTCKSGMFYYEENQMNCILNSEDRITQPDLFTNENQDVVTYFETGCFGPAADAGMVQDVLISNPADSVLKKDNKEWSTWSSCDSTRHRRRRFRACKTVNPNSCQREEAPCGVARSAQEVPKVAKDVSESNRTQNDPLHVGTLKDSGLQRKPLPSIKQLTTKCLPLLDSHGKVDCKNPSFRYEKGVRKSCTPENCTETN
jgi:hypothetical protein